MRAGDIILWLMYLRYDDTSMVFLKKKPQKSQTVNESLIYITFPFKGLFFDKIVIFSDKMSFFLEKTSNYQKNVDFWQKCHFFMTF
jgi:hypothetical protein